MKNNNPLNQQNWCENKRTQEELNRCAAEMLYCECKNGEFEHEPIKHQGEIFCSDECARDFDAEAGGFWESMGEDPCGKG